MCSVTFCSILIVLLGVGAFFGHKALINKGANGYDFHTTAEQVVQNINVAGKTALVTGTTIGGLGYETARVLANRGVFVMVHARNLEKAKATAEALRQQNASVAVLPVVADLSDMVGAARLGLDLAEFGREIDYVILNAGLGLLQERRETAQGYEMMMGVNHLGHAALMKTLLPLLKAARTPTKVVLVSSGAHAGSDGTFIEDEKFENPSGYGGLSGYCDSKLANVLYAHELNRRYKDKWNIAAFSIHPGAIITNFGRYIAESDGWLGTLTPYFFTIAEPLFFKQIDNGAATQVYCAVDDQAMENAGKYFEDGHLSVVQGAGAPVLNNATALNLFWEKTEAMIKPWVEQAQKEFDQDQE